MKLTVQVKLLPSKEQADALKDTLRASNAAANGISEIAWEHRSFGQYKLHKLAYHPVKESSGLSSQMVIRAIAKVADAYKLDKRTRRKFRPLGAIAYDDRILRWCDDDEVSIWTVAGRQTVPFVCGQRTAELLESRQGESDLLYRDGKWFLLATVNAEEPPPGTPEDWIGVDLGIANVAVDSTSETRSGPSDGYFAGHFDGEGSIYMSKRGNSDRCRLHISVTAGYKQILEEYKRRFGGQVSKSSLSVNKQLMRWTLNDLSSQWRFLQTVRPFAYEKKGQIEAALDYLQERRKYPLRGNGGVARFHIDKLSQQTLQTLKDRKKTDDK